MYAARAHLTTVCVAKEMTGGLVSLTNEVENYPGFVELIGGPELMQRFEGQARRLGAEFEFTDIHKVEASPVLHPVAKRPIDWQGQKYHAKTIMIATGRQPNRLPAQDEEELERGPRPVIERPCRPQCPGGGGFGGGGFGGGGGLF